MNGADFRPLTGDLQRELARVLDLVSAPDGLSLLDRVVQRMRSLPIRSDAARDTALAAWALAQLADAAIETFDAWQHSSPGATEAACFEVADVVMSAATYARTILDDLAEGRVLH